MTRKSKKRTNPLRPEAIATRANRMREVRDIYNKLRKKYVRDEVYKFFRENYFLQPESVDKYLKKVDACPVEMDRASLIYKQSMSESFYL